MKSINKDFMYLRPARLSSFGSSVEKHVAKYPQYFPMPEPSLITMAEKREALTQATAKAINGGRKDRQERDVLYKDYKEMVLTLSRYVSLMAGTNEDILALSGFNITRTRQRIGIPEVVTGVQFKRRPTPAEIFLKWKPTRGAKSYCIKFQNEESAIEYMQISLCAKALVRLPQPRQTYLFQIAAVSTKGQGPWSQVLKAFII